MAGEKFFSYQGWRGWRNEAEQADWVDCTIIVCLEMQKRVIGWYDIIWGILCAGSYIACAFVGKLYYNNVCFDQDKVKHLRNPWNVKHVHHLCQVHDPIYWVLVGVVGTVVLMILGLSRAFTPRLRCKFEGSSRFFALIGTLFELTTVGVLGAFLHVHHQSFCWLFVILGVFDLCAMKLLVPNYDFNGPAVLAQVGIATSLFPDVRKLAFTPWVICASFGIYVLKTLLDTNWRVVLPDTLVQTLNNSFGVFAEADDTENDEENVVRNDGV